MPYDPQAYILRPDVVLKLSGEIVKESTGYGRTRRAAQSTLETLRNAYQAGEFILPKREMAWLNNLSEAADELPENEDELIARITPTLDPNKIRLDQYGIA